jgi:hypothetical protein
MMTLKTRFVEFDTSSGELVIHLPAHSQELRRIVLERLNDRIHEAGHRRPTLDDLEETVTYTLLENAIPID